MNDSILNYLEKNNQFPIIFIGAGISKRYLTNYPSWLDLLEKLWLLVNPSEDFYSYLLKTQETINENNLDLEMVNIENIDHMVNTSVASEIEQQINHEFYSGNLPISSLTTKDAYLNKISPFKKLICNDFSSYTIKDSMQSEYESFQKMLSKSQFIMTTNYDSFIEDSYKAYTGNPINIFIGEDGLYKPSIGYAELYKLHGCYSDINSIIITKKDYERFNKSSVLISSKIISLLLKSPIIFLGYSLKDVNIQKIIKDFSSSLSPNDRNILEKNLIFVDRKEGEDDIVERIESSDALGCRYTVIETDNFEKIYKSIYKINQGVTPLEINNYLHVIKNIIVDTGSQGNLDSVLVTRDDLPKLLTDGIKDKKLVIAVGDEQHVYCIPTPACYAKEYILNKDAKNITNTLRFLLTQSGRLPVKKYLTTKNIDGNRDLLQSEKKRLNNKLKRHEKDMNSLLVKSPNKSYPTFNSIEDIQKENYKPYHEYNVVAYNYNNISIEDFKQYLITELDYYINNEIDMLSEFRKLLVIYDKLIN